MNTPLFYLALFEIIFSLLISVGVIYVSYGILRRLFFKQNDLSGKDMAFTVLFSGLVFNIGLILSEILPQITQVVRVATTQGNNPDYQTIILYSALYLTIGFLITLMINSAVFGLFSLLTRGIDEYQEIRNNNLAVALIVSASIISITLIVKESIAVLISALLPYPQATHFL
jgi:hypothetical protein